MALDATCRIQHQYADVGVLDRPNGANDRVVLQILIDLATLTYPCGVDEVEVHAELRIMRVDRVTCRPSDVGDDVTLFADERIDEGRLPCVRTSDDGDTRSIEWLVFVSTFGEILDDGV